MDLNFTSRADAEIVDASMWYFDEGGEAVALGFVAEVERVAVLTAENPRLWPQIEPGVRRVVLRGFPFSLLYTTEPEQVLVLAVAHHRREAGYWRDRVPK